MDIYFDSTMLLHSWMLSVGSATAAAVDVAVVWRVVSCRMREVYNISRRGLPLYRHPRRQQRRQQRRRNIHVKASSQMHTSIYLLLSTFMLHHTFWALPRTASLHA